MKNLRLLAFVLVALMLSACFIGCQKVEKVTVNVMVSVIANDEIVFGPSPYTVEGPVDNPPTVLQAATEAFASAGLAYEASEQAILSIDDYAEGEKGEYTCYWQYLINNEVPEEGRANTILVQEGDVICFKYVKVLTSELAAAGSDD